MCSFPSAIFSRSTFLLAGPFIVSISPLPLTHTDRLTINVLRIIQGILESVRGANVQMFDMAVECGAAINIENRIGLTPLTMAATLAR